MKLPSSRPTRERVLSCFHLQIAVATLLAMGLMLGCGSSPAQGSAKLDDASAVGDRSSPESCGPVDASAGGGCHTQGQVVCGPSQVSFAASGPPVTVAAGSGALPAAAGGPLVNGTYRLVAETLYGPPEPNVAVAHVGYQVQAVGTVQCDVLNELYSWEATSASYASGFAGFGGHNCPRLTLEPDSGDGVPYTSIGDMLYVIWVYGYADMSRGLGLGKYEMVDAFERLPATARGPTTPSVPAACDTSRRLVAGARDPGCPSSAPAPGTSCNPQPPPLECEYGGDSWGRCTTFAACAAQPDGGYQFQIVPPSGCPPNPTQCPPTFSAGLALAGSSMSGSADAGSYSLNLTCNYPEGVCGCLACSSGCYWTCRARTDVAAPADGGAPCPIARPLAGDPCASEGAQCNYDNPCQPELSLGPSMVCQHGNWVQSGAFGSCPLYDPCFTASLSDAGDAD